MRECVANILGVELDRIGIKATTTENLGFVGSEDGISAHAVVLLEKAC
jgi:2-C-methyl-D-erythritol 2,4-cyclodiphosphate synthase